MRSFLKANWDSNLPIYKISQSKLMNDGISCLLLDVDGTLLSRQSIKIPLIVKKWIYESKKFFSIYLVSNNPSKKRISKIAKELDINYKYNALKPRTKCTQDIIKFFNKDSKNIAIIGDRIFTDIVVGNRCNIQTILVKRLNKKGLPIKINVILLFERFISFFL